MKYSKSDIINAIKKLATVKNRNWLTHQEFVKETDISSKQVLRYFDKWNEAVVEAGLRPLDHSGRPDSTKGISQEELINKIRDVARRLSKKTLTLSEFTQVSGISDRPVYRIFKTWNEALEHAGLKKDPNYNLRIPDEDLFDEYFRITNLLNRFPAYPEFSRRSKYSIGVYENRFGNFTEFRKHALKFGLDRGLVKPEFAQPQIEKYMSITNHSRSSYKMLEDRSVLGERINFRGLIHAPVNELGVVYLFGILAKDLGFDVESIQSGFPDCEATRRTKNNNLQRVRIEFEFESSNFVRHGHDIIKCDIIICWEHDWANCPLEVISLRNKLEEFQKAQ
jgi:hypothetical protein